jgi:DNA recombination protein RmuC
MNLAVLLSLAVLAAVGCLAWALIERGRSGRLALELRLVREQSEAGHEALRGQAAQTAQAVADTLVQRATETFMAQDRLAQEKLEAQLKPVAETLEKFREHVGAVEKARAEETGSLKTQIEQLMLASAATRDEALKLSTALRRGSGVQGRWGEQMLRNVLERAGLRHGVDFEEQVTSQGDDGALRPDVIVRLAGGGVFVIDAKVSLNDYIVSLEATDDAAREIALKAHADSLRRHVAQLSSKAYWSQFDRPPHSRSPDVVAMFVPLESAYACVSERDPGLVADAWGRKVAIVTPTALYPLLRAVAYGWRAEDQAANARQIAGLGRELYKRLSVMGMHVSNVGKGLEQAVSRYNAFVGSLETQVMSQARRFEDLKVDAEDRTIVQLAPVETAVRPLAKLTGDNPPERPTLTVGNRAPTSAA